MMGGGAERGGPEMLGAGKCLVKSGHNVRGSMSRRLTLTGRQASQVCTGRPFLARLTRPVTGVYLTGTTADDGGKSIFMGRRCEAAAPAVAAAGGGGGIASGCIISWRRAMMRCVRIAAVMWMGNRPKLVALGQRGYSRRGGGTEEAAWK